MEKGSLTKWINLYKKLIAGDLPGEEYDELYKWETIQHFQDNWTDEHTGETILSLLKQSFNKSNNNLWSGSHYLPYKTMLEYAEHKPEEVSTMFKELFDEQKNLYERIEHFQRKSSELRDEIKEDKDLAHYQSKRAVSVYLTLRYPGKYYLYKNDMFNNFCEATGFMPKPGRSKRYDYQILKDYFAMCEEIRELLIADQELIRLHENLIPDTITFEDNYHTLTQDFIYVVAQHLSKRDTHQISEPESNYQPMQKHPLNQILYGPPGTGKTYYTKNLAVQIVEELSDEEIKEKYSGREDLLKAYQKHMASGQIAFVTFHQSFAYEDFIEGIKPTLSQTKEANIEDSDSDKSAGVAYEIEEGVFKVISNRAQNYEDYTSSDETVKFNQDLLGDIEGKRFFKMSLGNTAIAEDDEIYQYCLENNCIALGWGQDNDFSTAESASDVPKVFKEGSEARSKYEVFAITAFKFWMRQGDIVFISEGNQRARAIGLVDGDYFFDPSKEIGYNHFRPVKWLVTNVSIPVSEFYGRNFSQQSIYKMYDHLVKKEFFKQEEAPKPQLNNHVLIIDEINRGNIASIFGELITLIEADKRIGRPEHISLKLPYSKQEFSVPSNLYIIGTMNTADRSVEALDTALRRRFSFKEIPPNPELIHSIGKANNGQIEGVNLVDLLQKINDRIELLLDNDHMIGHSYFLSAKNKQDLLQIFYDKIIPLLQEYFYGDYGKIGLVLGSGFVYPKKQLQNESILATFDYDTSGLEDRVLYQIHDYRKRPVLNAGEEAFTFIDALKKLTGKS